jgi:hypothetical protein
MPRSSPSQQRFCRSPEIVGEIHGSTFGNATLPGSP